MTVPVLFVDDESKILEAYRRTLRKSFAISAAVGGEEALTILQKKVFPVIVTDMQMPQMNGVELLAQVKEKYPDTIRIMLTGNVDQQTATQAINSGDVFRFLNKPCPPEVMTEAINKAIEQFQQQRAEKKLLEQTVRGSIEALVEILAITQPSIFGRVNRIKAAMTDCITVLKLKNAWELETVAMLSQIGLVSLPDAVLKRAFRGEQLSDEEQQQFCNHPQLAADLINRIPRLEAVAEAVRYQLHDYTGTEVTDQPCGKGLPLASRLLRPIVDLLAIESTGVDRINALARLQSNSDKYDPTVLKALALVETARPGQQIIEISVLELCPKHQLGQDIKTHSGVLLVEKGQTLSPSLVARLINFYGNGEIAEMVAVIPIVDEVSASNAA